MKATPSRIGSRRQGWREGQEGLQTSDDSSPFAPERWSSKVGVSARWRSRKGLRRRCAIITEGGGKAITVTTSFRVFPRVFARTHGRGTQATSSPVVSVIRPPQGGRVERRRTAGVLDLAVPANPRRSSQAWSSLRRRAARSSRSMLRSGRSLARGRVIALPRRPLPVVDEGDFARSLGGREVAPPACPADGEMLTPL